ncbi:MAG: DUF456 domain-containing protein [Phycisphaerae bacterium]|nr:DUF456 domain-containing protein [Phycisphaerae bacterium]
MFYLWAVLLVVANTVSLGLGLLGIPGNWLMLLCTGIFAWAYWGDQPFARATLIVLLALALFGELLEFFSAAVAVRTVGGTRRGAVGAIVGGILGGLVFTGLIPIPVLGTVIGACLGAFAGAWVMELSAGKGLEESVRAGAGAGIGHFIGINLKFLVGIVMWIIITIALLWP